MPSVLAVAFFSIILPLLAQLVDGGQLIIVGSDHGWTDAKNPDGAPFIFQNWANGLGNLTISDALDFGVFLDSYPVYLMSSLEGGNTCSNTDNGTRIGPGLDHRFPKSVIFNFTKSGQHCFTSADHHPGVKYCESESIMSFTVNVSASQLPGCLEASPPAVSSVTHTTSGPGLGDTATKWSVKASGNKLHLRNGPGGWIGSGGAPGPGGDSSNQRVFLWILAPVGGVAMVLFLTVTYCITRKYYWHRVKALCCPNVSRSVATESNSQPLHIKKDVIEAMDSNGENYSQWPGWGPRSFTFNELKEATEDFNSSLVIGVGGFGTVYKGTLRDSPGVPVAVKRLSQYASQGAREFMAEVNIISQLRHRNLVRLLGWCDEDGELLLVYEYMPNGDLDDFIFGSSFQAQAGVGHKGAEFFPLAWGYHYKILCGVAAALVYLHEEWEQRIVHRDVKTSNVMLDSFFNARLGDFGLARLSAHSQVPRTTLVAGTIGYIAPEFSLTGRSTDKTDVYAFGIVVLEVSCARRPCSSNYVLLDWVWELHKEEKLVEAIDPKLDPEGNEEDMTRALKVGLLCCHPDPMARPFMRDVLNILTCKTPLPKLPRSKPLILYVEDQER
ncbi:unnamed protein product [Calypogeia fissa]